MESAAVRPVRAALYGYDHGLHTLSIIGDANDLRLSRIGQGSVAARARVKRYVIGDHVRPMRAKALQQPISISAIQFPARNRHSEYFRFHAATQDQRASRRFGAVRARGAAPRHAGTTAPFLSFPAMPLSNAADYPLWVNMLIFLAAAGVIWVAGTRLTRALDAIAVKTRLEGVFVGMLLLGGITSLPEVANVTTASINGNPSLAINNLLGSAAINILLLAIADALIGRDAVTSIVAKPSTMMMAALCMIVLIIIAALLVLQDVLVGPLGIGSLAVGAVSLGFFWLATGYDKRAAWTIREEAVPEDKDGDGKAPHGSLPILWLKVVFYGALLFAAGYSLSQTGDAIAQQAGLTSAIVGFALIGTATSLPELVTVITALKLRRPEMAFGQVLGTNFMNLSLFPLGDWLFEGEPVMNTLGAFETVLALMGALLIGIFLVGLLERRNRTIFKMGIDSAVVIVLFAAGTALLARIPGE